MKILLVGEFSGFHNNLKVGLESLGHDVVLAATGDGFKKLPTDISIGSRFGGFLGKIDRVIKSLMFMRYAKNFDVVQFINPNVFSKGLGVNKFIISAIIKQNRKSFLVACGDDYAYVSKGHLKMRYSPIPDAIKYDYATDKHPDDNEHEAIWLSELISEVNGVIPVMYEYTLGYEGCNKLHACIPLPIDVHAIKFEEASITDVITVFHGDNRYGFKGTKYVQQAFDYLKSKYPNQLELIIAGQMPLNEYLQVMRRTHIVVDQVNSYSCGMNALYALAMGKVVLGGAEPEGLASLGISHTPVVNITPSSDSIVKALESLINDKNSIASIGSAGRDFVEKYHCSSKVAQQYLNVWSAL